MNTTQTSKRPVKVAILYRVLQSWRVPVFELISAFEDIDLLVLHGGDYSESKVKNYVGRVKFNTAQLSTIPFKMPTKNGMARVPIQRKISQTLENFEPEVVITEGASHLFGNIAAYRYCKRKNIPLIQWGLGELRGRTKSFQRKIVDKLIFKKIEQNSSAAIAYSSIGVEYYKSIGIRQEAIFLAHNSVDTNKRIRDLKQYCEANSLPYPTPSPEIFKIIFIGALTEGKSVDLLIEAFELFYAQTNDGALVILGDGDFRDKLEQLVIGKPEISGKVKFEGHVSGKLAPYLYDASIMVLPGLGGLAISEAMCHGVPVICHVADGTEQDLIQENNGVILDEMTPSNLGKVMIELYHDRERLLSMREAALGMIESGGISIEAYAEKVRDAVMFVHGKNTK